MMVCLQEIGLLSNCGHVTMGAYSLPCGNSHRFPPSENGHAHMPIPLPLLLSLKSLLGQEITPQGKLLLVTKLLLGEIAISPPPLLLPKLRKPIPTTTPVNKETVNWGI